MTARILHGDCRQILSTLAAGSVQTCVTSPPYFGLRSYLPEGDAAKTLEMGSEPSLAAYVAGMVGVFREVRRVLRDDGTLWLNMGDGYAREPGKGQHKPGDAGKQNYVIERGNGKCAVQCVPIGMKAKDLMMVPARLAIALQDDGWYLRSDIIWAKKNCMPESVRDRPTTAHEHVFLLTKRPSYFYDATAIEEAGDIPAGTRAAKGANVRSDVKEVNGRPPEYWNYTGRRNKRTVWHVATEPFPDSHFAVMPTAIVEPCILAGTSERGCCPACGAPWARAVERDRQPAAYDAQKYDPADATFRTKRNMGARYQAELDANPLRTIGWRATCSCDAGDPVPCTVLDPFFGAGTVGLVADRLGRDCIGIELNPEYADMAARRLRKDAGMFAEVSR